MKIHENPAHSCPLKSLYSTNSASGVLSQPKFEKKKPQIDLQLAGFAIKTYRNVDLSHFLHLWKYMKILPIPAH